MKPVIVLLALFALAGCANSASVHLPDGRQGYAIDCSGSARSWNMCFEKAGEICKAAGYDVYVRDGESGQVAAVMATPYNLAGSSMPLAYRNMLIACRGTR